MLINRFFILILFVFSNVFFMPAYSQFLEKENQDQTTLPSTTKLELKINFNEKNINQDFFINDDLTKYIEIGDLTKIKGLWTGKFLLNKSSIFWTNPNLSKDEIINSIKKGNYKIFLNFNVSDNKKLMSVDIVQRDIKYGSIGIQFPNNKQINYWTNAKIDNWFQVIRGKVFRVNRNELLTIFQTTVYEEKIPIYAFQGLAILNKV